MKHVPTLYLLANTASLSLIAAWLWLGLKLEISRYLTPWFADTHAAVAYTLSIMLWMLPAFWCWKHLNRLTEKYLADT